MNELDKMIKSYEKRHSGRYISYGSVLKRLKKIREEEKIYTDANLKVSDDLKIQIALLWSIIDKMGSKLIQKEYFKQFDEWKNRKKE